MRVRLITLAATGLLVLAGFTAAAIAGAGSPLDLLAGPAKSHGASRSEKPTRTREQSSARPRMAEKRDGDSNDERAEADEQKPPRSSSDHKVVLCHHTGSWKHPFHEIAVDEHAVSAHTGHGDTVGSCPSAKAVGAPAKNGKPPSAHRRSERHRRSPGQRDGHGNGRGKRHKPHPGSASKNRNHER
jgi:hypothetical protein